MSTDPTGLEVIRTDAENPRATIVLVHGAWHGAWCWHDGFAQQLAAAGISTVAPSLRGHAGSADGVRLNRMRMRDYVDDVASVVASCDAPPFLAGHSMGGGVVQGFLARNGAPPIAGAALLASMPPRGVIGVTTKVALHHPANFLAANATLNLGRLVRSPEQVRELFFSANAPDTVVESTTYRTQSESYLAFLDMLVLDRPKPRPLDVPLLVLGATDDTIFPPADVAATAKAWGTEPVMVSGIAHDVMLDPGWKRVAETLASWVLAQLA
ncbi:alpha/beta hydrolase [Nocardioides marmorisolisilvae]|uniref:alpha/beta hydrolase n=1 Tax=Nocardioides marmorisolisilvae TaxID=1542737 RepID=UPI00160A0DE3|nr:alpha/beta fold hydrolase [Nocardioides marmorisolisilvae]